MKSERRHKLQENALAHSLENLPKMGKESGSRLLLGIVTALLIVVLIRYYLNSKQEKKNQIATELADARYDLAELNGGNSIQRQMEVSTGMRQSLELSPDERKKLLEDIETKVNAVQAETDDVALVSQARNIRADAYVRAAVLGNPPEATTRPDLKLSLPPEEMLDDASRTYQNVLGMKGVPMSEAADAHFGLGAIAENRKEWDKARTQYETVAKDAGMAKAFTGYAGLRLEVLDKISKPFLVGKPMTMPATTHPATGPAETPGPGPVAPLAPATGPFEPFLLPPSTGPVAPYLTPATGPAAPALTPATGPVVPPVSPTTAPKTLPAPATGPVTPATSSATQATNEGYFGTKDDLFYP